MSGPIRLRPARRRLVRHVAIAAFTAAVGAVVVVLLDTDDTLTRLSMASAYSSLVLLGVTLVLGPWNVLRRRPNPVSTHLRRDIGIWAGTLALLHVVAGLQVHLRGSMERYFLFPPGQGLIPLRYDLFGIVNWLGVAAATIALLLLALSNDRSLRWLGRRRWKRLQQWNYGLFGLTLVHALGYQFIESRPAPWVAAVVLVTAAVIVAQFRGYRARRRSGAQGLSP